MAKPAPWKYNAHARTCAECKSQRPGMQPLTIIINGKRVRGYWHPKCFEIARKRVEERSSLYGK